MSDTDWIEKAARQIIDDAATVSPHNAKYHVASATSIIRKAYAAHCQALDANGLAKRIRLQICAATYAADGGEWSNTSDEAIDAAINYHLGPLYAELERLEAESDFRFQMQAQRDEARAAIDRMRKLLVECRPYMKHDRLCMLEKHDAEDFSICKCGLTAILTQLDAETGGAK